MQLQFKKKKKLSNNYLLKLIFGDTSVQTYNHAFSETEWTSSSGINVYIICSIQHIVYSI